MRSWEAQVLKQDASEEVVIDCFCCMLTVFALFQKLTTNGRDN